ncbi:MAG: putative transport system ATP-binding protein [Baekduia sp.]|jgi:putative ABC transport system ATP-binding protein/lipoprotein-releasing system ATP-binding protein|nr:putative transport system ATP-binding protein [Baekduia sp.]
MSATTVAPGDALVVCEGAARTYGSGPTATVALQPSDCTVVPGARVALRPGPVAVIFQGPSLLPPLTIEENVALPLVLAGATDRDAHVAARHALELVDLVDLRDKLPEEVSGGQAQRAAVARALAGAPQLILADEPTGQLDRANGAAVVDVLLAAAEHAGAALVVSTHDLTVADRLSDRWELHSGRLTLPNADAKEPTWSR